MSVVSYNVEVINNTNKLRHIVANTLALYNSALNYVCDVVLKHYDEINELNNLEGRMYLEHFITQRIILQNMILIQFIISFHVIY